MEYGINGKMFHVTMKIVQGSLCVHCAANTATPTTEWNEIINIWIAMIKCTCKYDISFTNKLALSTMAWPRFRRTLCAENVASDDRELILNFTRVQLHFALLQFSYYLSLELKSFKCFTSPSASIPERMFIKLFFLCSNKSVRVRSAHPKYK